ncbi:MAG: glycosyltransferase family 2 protein [Nitrospiraceae bacterium]|nr:glycosyltransferase family 2 protein [Nitrospiraceae bacterium]
MSDISVVINTLNEEAHIAECIRSIRHLAGEIVVCDMHSDDRTREIAAELGARVILHERRGYVEPARHYAISQARREWVLVLDADERMTEKLGRRLQEIAKEGKYDVVIFWSLFWYFGGWVRHGGFFSGLWPRFFRKSVYLQRYRPGEEKVHQNFSSVKQHPNRIKLSKEYYLLHLAYPDIEKYIVKTVGKYARIEAENRVSEGERFHLCGMLGDPAKEFLLRYVILQGFRDGVRGLVLSVLYAGFRFSMWANMWFLTKRPSTPMGDKEGE